MLCSLRTITNCVLMVCANQIKFHPLGYTSFAIVTVKNGCCVSAHLLGSFFSCLTHFFAVPGKSGEVMSQNHGAIASATASKSDRQSPKVTDSHQK